MKEPETLVDRVIDFVDEYLAEAEAAAIEDRESGRCGDPALDYRPGNPNPGFKP